ncbi:hypothetical protein J3R82DRAFT_938 [Butyriboletus roseoflavus]|nr:hypothetical protein J3R82DRAFT_938 [Butyriboletus roseoflavus]
MLSLKHFILQQRILRLYRFAIRASRCTSLQSLPGFCAYSVHHIIAIPDTRIRAETLLWFRAEIERNKHLTDTVSLSPYSQCTPSHATPGGNRGPAQDCQPRNSTALSHSLVE